MKLRMTETFQMVTTCEECGRTFDLLDEEQAEDWGYGHDCDPSLPQRKTKK